MELQLFVIKMTVCTFSYTITRLYHFRFYYHSADIELRLNAIKLKLI